MIKLIATDMDGTLLDGNGNLSKGALEAIHEAGKRGVRTVLATGRPLRGVKRFVDEMGITGPDEYVLTYNGAFVQNLNGKPVLEHPLTYDDLVKMEYFASKYHMNIHFETLDHIYTPDRNINTFLSYESYATSMPIRVRNSKELRKDIVISKIMFTGDPDSVDELQQKLPEEIFTDYSVSRSEGFFLEINNKNASKGRGVRELAERLGIKPDEVMILGDQGNDLSMFKDPDFHKVAMGNAIDELKERADYITKTNLEGGFAHAVRKFVLD